MRPIAHDVHTVPGMLPPWVVSVMSVVYLEERESPGAVGAARSVAHEVGAFTCTPRIPSRTAIVTAAAARRRAYPTTPTGSAGFGRVSLGSIFVVTRPRSHSICHSTHRVALTPAGSGPGPEGTVPGTGPSDGRARRFSPTALPMKTTMATSLMVCMSAMHATTPRA